MSTSLIIGIDPGLTGALALTAPGRVLAAHDMPTRSDIKRGGGERRRVDAVALTALLAAMPDGAALVIEATWASPGMGAVSAYSFGHGAGVIETVAAISGRAVRYVSPVAWKRALAVPADKRAAVAMATSLFRADYWPLQKHQGRAEAALIAEYGHRLTKTLTRGRNESL